MKKYRLEILFAVALFALNALLNGPLFMSGETPFRGSIEGGYAGMARFITQHPNPWGWNPFQYCGLPTQFMYLPGLPYLTAVGSWVTGIAPDYMYRLWTALFACLGPVTLFVLVRHFTGSRWWAVAAALGYTFYSPVYGLIRTIQDDRGLVQLPWRVQVLARYGEGPHNAGLTLLPLSLIALWRTLQGKRFAGAALLFAAICLLNWVAAFALAVCCLLMLISWWGEKGFAVSRGFAAAALAYLLACFWLTPTFVQTVAFNWPADAFNYHLQNRQRLLLVAVVLGVLVIRWLFRWRRGEPYLCFVTLGCFVFGFVVCSFYNYGADVIPESRRYALEWEMFLVLAIAEWFRLAMRSPDRVVNACAIAPGLLMLISGWPQAHEYVTQGWKKWQPVALEKTVEYRISKWLAAQRPEGRVFASGGTRYRLNSWFSVPQVGGGFESGLRNRNPVDLAYQARTLKASKPDQELRDSLWEMQALGTQYLVVHEEGSGEYYRDFKKPKMYGFLPAVYREEHDVVYKFPFTTLAHCIRPEHLADSFWTYKAEALHLYVPGTNAAPRLKLEWQGPSAMHITGDVFEGTYVTVQVSYDEGWSAWLGGKPLPVERDKIGFILLRPPPGMADIQMRYEGMPEQRLFALVSLLAWGWMIWMWKPWALLSRQRN